MTQFAQCLGFNLTNTFACYIELFADLFQCMVRIHVDTEAHSQYFRFSRLISLQEVARSVLSSFLLWLTSTGEDNLSSSMKSPIVESSSSPTGFSIESGSLAILRTLRILSSGNSISTESSSGVASRPNLPEAVWRLDSVKFVNCFNHMNRYSDGACLVCN